MSDPLPSDPLPPRIPAASPRPADGIPPVPASGAELDPAYNLIADKIGGLPNLRKKDNLYQAAAVGGFLVIGVVVGAIVRGWPEGVLAGALVGLVVGILLSGSVLMIIGLRRKS